MRARGELRQLLRVWRGRGNARRRARGTTCAVRGVDGCALFYQRQDLKTGLLEWWLKFDDRR